MIDFLAFVSVLEKDKIKITNELEKELTRVFSATSSTKNYKQERKASDDKILKLNGALEYVNKYLSLLLGEISPEELKEMHQETISIAGAEVPINQIKKTFENETGEESGKFITTLRQQTVLEKNSYIFLVKQLEKVRHFIEHSLLPLTKKTDITITTEIECIDKNVNEHVKNYHKFEFKI